MKSERGKRRCERSEHLSYVYITSFWKGCNNGALRWLMGQYSEGSNKRAETVTLHFQIPAQHGLIRYLHGPVSSEARSAEVCEIFWFSNFSYFSNASQTKSKEELNKLFSSWHFLECALCKVCKKGEFDVFTLEIPFLTFDIGKMENSLEHAY